MTRTPASGKKWFGICVIVPLMGCGPSAKPSEKVAANRAPAPAASAQAAQRIPVSKPEATKFDGKITATGTLKPQKSGQLSAAVAGTLEKTYAKSGQEVKAGSRLATLKAASARAVAAQALAGVEVAKAQLALAEDELKRTEAMRSKATLTEAQLIQAKGQRDVAAAQLQAAQAQWTQATVALSYHTLTAPFDGVIVRAPSSTGVQVDPAVPLFMIEDVSVLVLETSVTQEQAMGLSRDAVVSVEVLDTGYRVDDAKIRAIIPSVDPGTARVPIEVAVPNPARRMMSHILARVILPSSGSRDAYRVRDAALTQLNGSFALWMVEPNGKVIAPRVSVLAQLVDGYAVVEPGPNGFPQGANVLEKPPLGIAEGTQLRPESIQVTAL